MSILIKRHRNFRRRLFFVNASVCYFAQQLLVYSAQRTLDTVRQTTCWVLIRRNYKYEHRHCTNQQPPQRGGVVLDPVWVGSKWLLAFPRVPVTPGTPLHFFAGRPRGAAHSFFGIGRLFSLFLFSCPSLSPRSSFIGERSRSSQPWPHLSLLCVR